MRTSECECQHRWSICSRYRSCLWFIYWLFYFLTLSTAWMNGFSGAWFGASECYRYSTRRWDALRHWFSHWRLILKLRWYLAFFLLLQFSRLPFLRSALFYGSWAFVCMEKARSPPRVLMQLELEGAVWCANCGSFLRWLSEFWQLDWNDLPVVFVWSIIERKEQLFMNQLLEGGHRRGLGKCWDFAPSIGQELFVAIYL